MHTTVVPEIPLQEPLYVSYPPDLIITLAHETALVTLNIRPTHWPMSVRNAYYADPRWKARAERHHGRLMYPPFTEFLTQRDPEAKALISCQDAHGGIYTLVDAITDVYWVGGPNDCGEKGVHACILLKNKHRIGAPRGSIWGNYVLAISNVRPETPSMSMRDLFGIHFVELFLQNVVR